MHVPAAFLALPLLAGSAAATVSPWSFDERFPALCAAGGLLVLVAAVASALLDDPAGAVVGVVAGCSLAGLSLGTTAARQAYHPPLLAWFEAGAADNPVLLQGVLREDAAPTAFGASITLDVVAIEGVPGPGGPLGGVRLSIGGDLIGSRLATWRGGRTVRVAASLRTPSVYVNPGVPDERRSLARRGIVLVGSVKSGALVEVVAHGGVLDEIAASIRAWTRRRISAHLGPLDRKSAGVTTAVLIGDRTGLAREDERRMQQAGTYHVIAISGGNIAILAGMILMAARLLLVPARPASIVTAVALVAYGGIVVGAPSVSRAVTVAVLALGARVLDHRGAALNVLAMAAVLACAASPLVVLDAGFILSFGATLGILLGVPLIVAPGGAPPRTLPARVWRRIATAMIALFAATSCAEIALAPVGATIFSRVPLGGLLLNFAAIPLMTLVQAGGLVVVMTAGWWESAARAAGIVAHLAATGLLESARLVDVAPWLSVDVRPPAWGLTVAYYACALGVIQGRRRRAAALGLATAGGLILFGPHLLARDYVAPPRLSLRVAVLDVGQGDATLVQLPDGRALLVDAGGLPWLSPSPDEPEAGAAFDIGDRVVLPAIRALGITRLDGLVITHADPDHVQGARGVLRRLAVRSVWDGIPVPPDAGLLALASLARERGISWRSVQAGDTERFGDVEVRVIHPPPPDWERQRVRNDDSVVLDVRLGRVSIILPGDIGQEGERAILPRLEPGRLVVLKAPHHGSASSSTPGLLDVLRPAAVIFSSGRDNRFGHPHASVVARFRSRGTEMFSTAEDGAVFVETDGATVEVWGWTGRRRRFDLSLHTP